MECEVWPENGPGCSTTEKEGSGLQKFKYEHRYVGGRNVRLGFPSGVLGEALDRQMYLSVVPVDRAPHQKADNNVPTDLPFMNNMDEISYWIYTKRAPCLMNYDNLIKKQNEEAHSSKSKSKSVPNIVKEVPSPKKKKKRKLSLLSDSLSDNDQKNIYFDTSQKQNRKAVKSSDGLGSDIDFNIKNSFAQRKPKRSKLQKSSKTTLHKKNNLVTSTPKVTSLRRSLRQKQQSINNGHINMSLTFNSSVTNGNNLKNNITLNDNSNHKLKEPCEILAGEDRNCDKKNTTTNDNLKNDILNGQFEDLSDMSGFTANYIRSTKVQSKKTSRKLRCKTSKNLIKESRQHEQKDSTSLVCVNKSANTRLSKNLLNFSTDSSQNVINLVSTNNNDKSSKVDKSMSQLKFLDKTKNKECTNDTKQKKTNNVNISFESTTSRYPKRSKNAKVNNIQANLNSRNISKNSSEFDHSDRKENPEEKLTSRTRSGRSIGLTLRQPENSVLVLSNSTGHVSSTVSMNVASPNEKLKKKKCVTNRPVRTRRSGQSMQRDSVRDKSGFATCFSDSDEDSEPLQRKFFCA